MFLSLTAITFLAVSGSLDVWVESPMTRVHPRYERPRKAAKQAKLFAAGGERESFQICVRSTTETSDPIQVEGVKLDEVIGSPEVRVVGFLAYQKTEKSIPILYPDPLLDSVPVRVAPGETRSFWITYTVPPNALPGPHKGEITVVWGKQRISLPVMVTVFGFTIPSDPTLRSGFVLDRTSICSVYGIDNTSLEAWKPIYDALGDERIAYRLWNGDALVSDCSGNTPQTSVFKEHLDYLVNRAHMNTLDIGAGAQGISLFPLPPEEERTDPLQTYLFDMTGWLAEKGWLDRAFIETAQVGERAMWQNARDASFRVKRNDPRIKRLIRGPYHPYFERYAELWAVSPTVFDPYAETVLREGHSLVSAKIYRTQAITASSTSTDTMPEDGYDGSLFSSWVSQDIPNEKAPEWFQLDFASPVTADRMKILWRPPFEGSDMALELGRAGQWFRPESLTWKSSPSSSAYKQSWAEVRWSFPEPFTGIRLWVRNTYMKGPVGITDLEIGDTVTDSIADMPSPIATWFCASEKTCPSFRINAHSVEPRLFPWFCWGMQAEGFLSESLTRWPEDWKSLVPTQPAVWSGLVNGEDVLFYPGKTAPIPSIRAMLLRDGMEDYEYLVQMEKVIKEKGEEETDPKMKDLCAHLPLNPMPSLAEINQLAERIQQQRIAIGEALSGGMPRRAGKPGTPSIK